MTVTLELTPIQERTLQSDAQREGVPIEQFILRRLVSTSSLRFNSDEMERQIADGFAASGMTEEELDEYVIQSVKQVRAEIRARDAQP